jgi:PAS domain S-box-containing protein
MVIFDLLKPNVEKLEKERDIESLIQALGHKDKNVRRGAAKALGRMGEDVVEPLIEAVRFNDSDVRMEAAEVLGEIRNYVVVVIRGGLIKFVNSAVTKITGLSKRETIGKQFTDFVSPEYEKTVLERYKKRLMDEKTPSVYEVEILSKDENKIPVEINASLIEYEGRPADLAIIRDLSHQKRASNKD